MNIGEKIAKLRKEKGLSQESLGYELGVSRQAISKWESGASVPDLEKLISMSRLFGVSAGWLLGTEDENAGGDLTPAQVKVVEAVLERYISALEERRRQDENSPQEGPAGSAKEAGWIPKDGDGGEKQRNRKKSWFAPALAVVFAVAVIIWCAQMENTVRNIESNYSGLRNEIQNINIDVNSITSRVEDMLSRQSDIFARFDYEVTGTNLAEDTITIKCSGVPKVYGEDTRVEYSVESGGETFSAAAPEKEGRMFETEITCPLSDSIVIMASVETEGKLETAGVGGLSFERESSAPGVYGIFSIDAWGVTLEEVNSGKVSDKMVIYINEPDKDYRGNTVNAEKVDYFIFLNGKKIRSYQGVHKYPEGDGQESFEAEFTYDFHVGEGDTVYYCYVITDNYGREFYGSLGGVIMTGGEFEIDDASPPEGYPFR